MLIIREIMMISESYFIIPLMNMIFLSKRGLWRPLSHTIGTFLSLSFVIVILLCVLFHLITMSLWAVWEQTNFCVTVHGTLSRCKDSIKNVSYTTRFGLFDKHVLCIVIDCAKWMQILVLWCFIDLTFMVIFQSELDKYFHVSEGTASEWKC